MSDCATHTAAQRPAQKNGRHEGGQVQGGNAQEGRRLRDQGSQYRAAAICRKSPLYASVKTHFVKIYAAEIPEKPHQDIETSAILSFCDILCSAK